ncbi:MAG: hypothetical protein WAQ98_29440 [Blastocatellia bacterium]
MFNKVKMFATRRWILITWLLSLSLLIACVQETKSTTKSTNETDNKQIPLPPRLAIYYGFPSLVNGAKGDLTIATNVFASYDIVVFGDGLEFKDVVLGRKPQGAGLAEHENTRQIISRLSQAEKQTRVYGYVDLGNSQNLSLAEIENRVRLWADMGVAGIFLDEAGYDYGVNRSRQNSVIKIIRKFGLSAFLNAFNLEDLFEAKRVPLNKLGGGNPTGEACILGANDLVLLESFQIRNGEFDDNFPPKIAESIKYREVFEAKILGVTTVLPNQAFDQAKHDYAWWSAALWQIDGFGWGEPNYSSSDNMLPLRQLPQLPKQGLGSNFTSDVISKKAKFLRKTNLGKIIVNVKKHTGSFVAN